jgi:calpain-7
MGSRTYGSQEAELAVDNATTREAALENAILAAELYMAATKLASSGSERAKLRAKCRQLTSRAESIKKSASFSSSTSSSSSRAPVQSKELSLRAPVSQRPLSKREEIILLEGSKLHGFIFPQWTSDPDDTLFASEEKDRLAYMCVLSSGSLPRPLLTALEILLI